MSYSIYNAIWISDRQTAFTWGGCLHIPLPCGREALLDIDDLPLVQGQSWFSHPSKDGVLYYVVRASKKPLPNRLVYMHHIVRCVASSVRVDHWNGSGLDNRQQNLREASARQNMQNRSKHIGVSKFKGVGRSGRRWRSRIANAGGRITLGYFATEHEAAEAYDTAARQQYGEFARLNFPTENEQSAIMEIQ